MKVEKINNVKKVFTPYNLVLTIESENDELILDGISNMDASIPDWVKETKGIEEKDTENLLRILRRSL